MRVRRPGTQLLDPTGASVKPKSVSPTRSHARLWLPILVLLAGLMITFGMWNRSRAALKREVHGDFDAQSRDALTRIEARLRYYEQALLGTRGLFKASESVTRGEFATYVAGLDLAARYPGIQGIGFAVLIPADEKERHLSQIRRSLDL